MNKIQIGLFCAFVSTAFAQVGGYLGPGVLSSGAGTIGTRSGQQVDLRFFADVSGVYDTGYQPYEVDSKGNLVTINGLYGVQLDGGAYGTHSWRTAQLGLDYSGSFYDYTNATKYDGSMQSLAFGYTYQKSRRLSFDFRQIGGLSTINFASPVYLETPTSFVGQPTSAIFDSRFYYLQSSADMNIITSARTTFTIGGDGYWVRYSGQGLANLNGYNLRGEVQHRLSRTKTIGFIYERLHNDFAPAFGHSDINVGEGFYSTSLGRRWTFAINGGVFQSEVSGIQQVTLNPVLAALLGETTGTAAFYREDIYPSGSVNLTGKLKNSSLTLAAGEHVSPGNGVYLTSRMESGTLSYSYTGIKKWNFAIYGGYFKLAAIGQHLQDYSTWNGGANASYGLTRSFHLVARFDARDQQIHIVGYKNQGYRTTLGIAWSPGDVPLSLW
ncbi:MAG TPA: hypothetical protein VK419_02495 [Bryobacteraceae bacterium]|nr:hypothetical protein [Bryobacteraceae bacterium]